MRSGQRLSALLLACLLVACGGGSTQYVAPDAVPTPAPTPAPTQAGTWRMVAQFKGYDGGPTKPFTTTGPWRLTFLIEDSLVLTIKAYPDGRIVTTLPFKNSRLDGQPHIGSLTVAHAGSYVLDLFPIGYYQIDIEEPRS